MNRRKFLGGTSAVMLVPPLALSARADNARGAQDDRVHVSMRCLKCKVHLEAYSEGVPNAKLLAEMQGMMQHHLASNHQYPNLER